MEKGLEINKLNAVQALVSLSERPKLLYRGPFPVISNHHGPIVKRINLLEHEEGITGKGPCFLC